MNEYQRIERHRIDIEDVIKELRKRFTEVQNDRYIQRPISYTLYHLWYDIDKIEENR